MLLLRALPTHRQFKREFEEEEFLMDEGTSEVVQISTAKADLKLCWVCNSLLIPSSGIGKIRAPTVPVPTNFSKKKRSLTLKRPNNFHKPQSSSTLAQTTDLEFGSHLKVSATVLGKRCFFQQVDDADQQATVNKLVFLYYSFALAI
ncbi:hypothetical protein FEM48_Zijuj10G0099400 [Ziziphus jujuba var. spinosa]|uniref:Uncharacterized protein n=1 Tax=Ziziphus jujuba var. spinosa TaxID=714518 RepID=A0A978UMQ1_ZIZJJ|nr:hypothetical protein FEM48_Zijuj10G0099400 [Ziziphus jujuba var. spinosa]